MEEGTSKRREGPVVSNTTGESQEVRIEKHPSGF